MLWFTDLNLYQDILYEGNGAKTEIIFIESQNRTIFASPSSVTLISNRQSSAKMTLRANRLLLRI